MDLGPATYLGEKQRQNILNFEEEAKLQESLYTAKEQCEDLGKDWNLHRRNYIASVMMQESWSRVVGVSSNDKNNGIKQTENGHQEMIWSIHYNKFQT